jgi:hypothetical protein
VLALGAGLGAAHGLLIARLRLQPFIVTLCGLLLYRGAARYVADDSTKGFGTGEGFEWLRAAAAGHVAGVPMPFVILCVIAVVAWLVVHRSVYGRHLIAVGQISDFGEGFRYARSASADAPDLEMLDPANRAAERIHALTKGNDVPFSRAFPILQKDVMLEHRSVPTDT